jgi:hypothetical protein
MAIDEFNKDLQNKRKDHEWKQDHMSHYPRAY